MEVFVMTNTFKASPVSNTIHKERYLTLQKLSIVSLMTPSLKLSVTCFIFLEVT